MQRLWSRGDLALEAGSGHARGAYSLLQPTSPLARRRGWAQALGLMKRIAFATLFILSSAIARADSYTNEMFRQALANRSTSPDYVLITVTTSGGKPRAICTTANFLLGAIHREHGFSYSED